MDREILNYTKNIIKNNAKELSFSELESINFSNNIFNILFTILPSFGKSINKADFEQYFKIALNEYKHDNPIKISLSKSLVKNKKVWLTHERQKDAGWVENVNPLASYRTRYLEYLKSIGRVSQVVDEVAMSSLSILEKIEDPLVNYSFQKKGLVVGSVQSGKTGNFNAVINSSIDLGYRLIIVLSGGMEDLRKQTQERIQKEVEGREHPQGVWNGVGKIAKFGAGYYNKEQIVIPTSIDKDFNLGLSEADFALDKINVLVVKKNTSILRNILIWLKRFATEETIDRIPLLIIDDEADNASLNNLGHKGQEEASRINLQIRCILNLFSKSSYIGYTATPFANILQDRNDRPQSPYNAKLRNEEYSLYPIGNLFPEDFIELLSPPSNYIGPKNFFETKISEVKKIPTLLKVVNDWYGSFPYRVYKSDENVPYYFNIDDIANEIKLEYLSKEFPITSLEDLNVFIKKHNPNSREYSRLKRLVDQDFIALAWKKVRSESKASTKYCDFPNSLPESLKDAVKCFIIACAVRLKRKQEMKDSVLFQKHNSMLIHISRFTSWQNKTTELLESFFKPLKESLNNDPIDSPIYRDLERVWNKYYLESIENGIVKEFLPDDYHDDFMSPMTFNEVLKYLISAVNDIEIVCANSDSKFKLDYSNGPKKYIVIGGNRLSRGFTLEGLTINYFVRDTNYADSLLQMGRWFGYRLGYLDCCKLFTTADTIESFDFSTSVIEDIEAQFSLMASKNKKPSDFAIKVMNDPDVIKITRPSILKNAETIKWSYSDKLDQTTKFSIDKDRIENAWSEFLKYFGNKSFKDYGSSDKPIIKYYDTDVKEVCHILSMDNSFINPQHYKPLIRFIEDVSKEGSLSKWTVGIRISGNGKEAYESSESFKFPIHPAIRAVKDDKFIDEILYSNKFTASGDSSNLMTNGSDFSIGLTEDETLQVEKEFRDSNGGKKSYPEKIYRQKLDSSHGVLIIYPIDMKSLFNHEKLNEYLTNRGFKENVPLLGFAVGIPNLGDDFEKNYFVQKGFLDEHGNILNQYDASYINEEDDENEDQHSDELEGYIKED
ncbi:Z1 domain-containing protein [Empedobacter falsenii]|uniref:Z1 domain-containing protein n=1 Tax=Empedobacter falsenii TaxID=343874 RepID=UPI003A7F6B25